MNNKYLVLIVSGEVLVFFIFYLLLIFNIALSKNNFHITRPQAELRREFLRKMVLLAIIEAGVIFITIVLFRRFSSF